MIGHDIINVLDKDNVCIEGLQIGQQRAVPSRAKQQVTILISERLILEIDSDGVGGRALG